MPHSLTPILPEPQGQGAACRAASAQPGHPWAESPSWHRGSPYRSPWRCASHTSDVLGHCQRYPCRSPQADCTSNKIPAPATSPLGTDTEVLHWSPTRGLSSFPSIPTGLALQGTRSHFQVTEQRHCTPAPWGLRGARLGYSPCSSSCYSSQASGQLRLRALLVLLILISVSPPSQPHCGDTSPAPHIPQRLP